ncbi:hypothetical protein DS745_21555 [Anaerobacillus alkaliphilus]|uniref:Uncharacterized protein n=1 Tax=Anaerobacillus alkaliphilus TaxID=1548597 RepID=A0A4Q0VMA3_9BACI|nr:hypothetical protein [Anaerobacillus alkaliphilus]RXI96313.1 hypothetical protein DS745_21555 [Anaerobacillus alkaliphilus]
MDVQKGNEKIKDLNGNRDKASNDSSLSDFAIYSLCWCFDNAKSVMILALFLLFMSFFSFFLL